MIGTVFMDIAEQWRHIDRFLMDSQRLAVGGQAGRVAESLSVCPESPYGYHGRYSFWGPAHHILRPSRLSGRALIVQNRTQDAEWAERRIWQAWYGTSRRRPDFMKKVEILFDKNRNNFRTIQYYHKIRNGIAHGGEWTEQLAIPQVAEAMDSLVSDFPTT